MSDQIGNAGRRLSYYASALDPWAGMNVAGGAARRIGKGMEAGSDLLAGRKVLVATKVVEGTTSAASKIGGGRIIAVNESMSAKARAYQAKVAGLPEGTAFLQNGVKCDGYESVAGAQTLVDAKFGMDFMVEAGGSFKEWSRLPGKLVAQANSQLSAADGARIEWRFSSGQVAAAVENLFENRGIAIAVVHMP